MIFLINVTGDGFGAQAQIALFGHKTRFVIELHEWQAMIQASMNYMRKVSSL
jgi:hypothetical protein